MDVNFKTTLSAKVCKPLRPVTNTSVSLNLQSEMITILGLMLLLLREYSDTQEQSDFRPPMAAHDSQSFLLCSPTVVCRKCVFRQPKLATYYKGQRGQTLNICSLLHMLLRL